VCVSPLAGPGMWHTAHNGGEHQSGDEGEEDQVDDALHAVVAQPGQRLDVVLLAEERSSGAKEKVSAVSLFSGRDATHHVEAAAVDQGGQLVKTDLGGIQHGLDLLETLLQTRSNGSTLAHRHAIL